MKKKSINLFQDIPKSLDQELVEKLITNDRFRMERIVSRGHASPSGFWYDQDEHELVVVLKGEAKLLFEGDDEPIHMKLGDFVNIPAYRKHRVEWTTPDEPTVWLAVFYDDGQRGIE